MALVPWELIGMILHITEREAWEQAKNSGRYEAESLHSQGFIHCSRPDQVIPVANCLFRGQTSLVLLCIDTDRAVPEICHENLEGGSELFPHIYGALNLDAVTAVLDFEPGCDGRFALPEELKDRCS